MKAIGEFLILMIRVVWFPIRLMRFLVIASIRMGWLLARVAIIGSVWLISLLIAAPLAIVHIFLAGLGAAIAHSKERRFLEWLFWGTLCSPVALIAAIAIRRPPIVVHISKEQWTAFNGEPK